MVTGEGWKVKFERLYEANGELVFNFVKGILRQREEAEDCTVETFEAAFKALRKGQVHDPSRAWLLTIARHRAFRRAKTRKWFISLDDQADQAVETGFDRQLLAAAELGTLMEPLNKEEREAIWMHDGLGLTHQEIGEIMGAPLGTILARIFRGRKKIQQRLKEGCLDASV